MIRIASLALITAAVFINGCVAETAVTSEIMISSTATLTNSDPPPATAVIEKTAVSTTDPGHRTVQTVTPINLPTANIIEAVPTITRPSPFLLASATDEPTTEPLPTPTFAAYGITQTIGLSAQGRPLISHQFGFGNDKIVLVGGIHGGYEWNTIVLAYELIDYFNENPHLIPNNVTLYIIPSANPDGQFVTTQREGKITAVDVKVNATSARFNGNGVDLNRNWDCNWQETAVWGKQEVNGGKRPFSEPETQALRRFFLGQNVDAVIFWHSKADGVYAGGCDTVYAPSFELTTLFGEAAGYPVYEQFPYYPITGDASDWLTQQGIPSFSVELKTHTELDWDENLGGILAIIAYFQR